MNRLFLVGLVAVSVVLGGCVGGGGSSSKSKKCDPTVDTKRCAGSSTIQACDPDSSKWETVQTCAAGTECTEAGGSPVCSVSAPPVESCESNADCVDGTCVEGACVPNHCFDAAKSGDETYTDCGGSCPVGCDSGLPCGEGSDCASRCCEENGLCADEYSIEAYLSGSCVPLECSETGDCHMFFLCMDGFCKPDCEWIITCPCTNGGTCSWDASCGVSGCICPKGTQGEFCDEPGGALEKTLEACSDGLDNDSDGFVNCDDFDCNKSQNPEVLEYCEENS